MEEQLAEQIETSLGGAPAKAASRPLQLSTFSSLRHPDFRYLCTGTFMMSAGQSIQQVTLGWLIYDLTANSILLGAFNGLRALPFLVTGPMAGVGRRPHGSKKIAGAHAMGLVVTAILVGSLVAVPLFRSFNLIF